MKRGWNLLLCSYRAYFCKIVVFTSSLITLTIGIICIFISTKIADEIGQLIAILFALLFMVISLISPVPLKLLGIFVLLPQFKIR